MLRSRFSATGWMSVIIEQSNKLYESVLIAKMSGLFSLPYHLLHALC